MVCNRKHNLETDDLWVAGFLNLKLPEARSHGNCHVHCSTGYHGVPDGLQQARWTQTWQYMGMSVGEGTPSYGWFRTENPNLIAG